MSADLSYAVLGSHITPRPWTHGSGYAACAGLGREVNMNKRTIAHVGIGIQAENRRGHAVSGAASIRSAMPPADRPWWPAAPGCSMRPERPAPAECHCHQRDGIACFDAIEEAGEKARYSQGYCNARDGASDDQHRRLLPAPGRPRRATARPRPCGCRSRAYAA